MKIYQHKLKKEKKKRKEMSKKKRKNPGLMAFSCEIKTKYYILPMTLLFNR